MAAYPIKPTVTIFSGGGKQAFWRLKEPTSDFEAVESRNSAVAKHLRADRVQNADRMMRVAGTINMPNQKKRLAGRKPALAYIDREMTDWSREYTLADFPVDPEGGRPTSGQALRIPSKVDLAQLPPGVTPYLKGLITRGDDADHPIGSPSPRFKSRSEVVFRVACDLIRAGCADEVVAGVLLCPNFGISASVREKRSAQRYALRQVASAREAVDEGWPDTTRDGKPRPTLANALLAIRRLGIVGEYDAFRRRKILGGHTLQEFQGDLSDDGCAVLRHLVLTEFGFDPRADHIREAANLICLENTHHPVRDYLSGLEWDRVARIDEWLTRYLGAEDTPLNRAFGRIVLLAAVRRVRQPGVKFDYILVLEGKQGSGKSTAIQILASPDWFSDQEILLLDSRGQVEAMEGVWIYELGELDGLSRADTNKVKAFASRQTDRARMAYARFRETRPRESIFIGTTNDETYLRDQTGNRRFWPVRTGAIDLETLRRDRDQLWAEAAAREALCESIALDQALWADANVMQEARVEEDPWRAILEEKIRVARQSPRGGEFDRFSTEVSGGYERVLSTHLLTQALRMSPDQVFQHHSKRLAMVMRSLGWDGPKPVRVGGITGRGYERKRDDV